jgi:Glycosyl hydrolase family 47
VDALDTLYIMGMKDEFDKAREWVANNLDMSTMVRIRRIKQKAILINIISSYVYRSKLLQIPSIKKRIFPAFKIK